MSVAAALIVTACSSASDTQSPAATASPPSSPTSTAVPVTTVEITSTTDAVPTQSPPTSAQSSTGSTLNDQIEWVVELLGGASVTEADVERRFSAEFLAQVPSAQILATVEQLRGVATDWTLAEVVDDGTFADVSLTTAAGPWVMSIGVEPDGSIAVLTVQPDSLDADAAPTSFDELITALGGAGDVAMLAADVSDGTCEAVHEADADVTRPIGSDFKLYVLGALVDAVEAGEVSWDQPLAIRDDLKSLPSGTFQDLAAGTERTIREFAAAMISVSDNTATDHLIDLLGREQVHAAQSSYGHAEPSLNDPFLTTRELFVLKLVVEPDVLDEYVAGTSDERRAFLDTTVADLDVTLDDAITFVEPRRIDELEWFASPFDLCRAMVELHAGVAEPDRDVIRSILGENPAVDVDDGVWSYVGFKGGSEPGVLSLVWYLERDIGSFVYVVNVANSEMRLPEAQLVQLATVGIDLLTDEQ